ncbi:glutamate receptor ionotropic, kainate 2 [Musca domestica]|uniref:Glutamate receptor ionotropic, kainate 2 n=1 Tax=Musca domestica TaxID=7370 RepID=A0ABM3V8P4_MUSDO|nr:glutamate receptor ionotropic, kainate 2 [Musca domestica]
MYRYWCLLLIVFNTLHISCELVVVETRTTVKVGALFFSGEDETELAFDEAIRQINNQKLFELQFETIKRYVPNEDDSLVLQQLTCELLAQDVAAIFGPSSRATTDIVALIANNAGIPHLQYDWDIDIDLEQRRLNHQMSVSVAPALQTVARAYLDIIRKDYKWRKFTLIYETEQGLARIQDLMNVAEVKRENIKIRNLAEYEDDMRVLWKEIEEDFHEQRLIMDCKPESLVPLLNQAKEFKLLGPFRNWFLTHLDTHSSGLFQANNADFQSNITSVRVKGVDANPFERKKTRITEVDQLLGNQTMLPTLMYDAVVLFANAARNVITGGREFVEPAGRCDAEGSYAWVLGKYIVGEMKRISEDDVEPPFKTENMKIDEYGLRSEFNLEIYKPTINEPLATWSPDGSIQSVRRDFQISSSSSAAVQDFAQSRRVYRVVTHIEEPYFMMKEDAENFRGDEKYEGYAVDLIQKLSEMMEFEYEFVLVNGNGKFNPVTKEWDGIMRSLIDHRAQIGVCDLTITQLRRKYVDFTVPFMQLGISILFYKPDPEVKDIFAFLQPFAKEVWMYVILTQLVMTLAFVFMARISHHEWENPNPLVEDPEELENKWRTRNTAWLMIGSIMQQGCDLLPRGAPMRMLTAMWWFFALMMLSTYTANLAAVLTSNKIKPSIESLEDLIDQHEIKFGTLEGGSTSLFFSESNETNYQKAWNQMKSFEPSAFTKSNKEGVERVRKGEGKYAFLMETTSLSYNTERDCHLQQIGDQIGEKHYGLAVPLGADYRTNLSVSILKLSETNELYKLKKKWWKNHNVTCEDDETDPQAVDGDELSLIELGGVFLVLVGGIVVAIIIGILEFLWNVQKVAVREKVTPGEAFKAELIFALKFWITKKPNRISSIRTNSDDTTSRASRSTSRRSSSQSKQSKQSKHSKHSKVSKRSKRSKRSRSRSRSHSKSRSKKYSTSG